MSGGQRRFDADSVRRAQRGPGDGSLRRGLLFFDLVRAGIGVCAVEDIAISVLTAVIGRQGARGRILVDAGWMAMSRDRGTASQAVDKGTSSFVMSMGASSPTSSWHRPLRSMA